MPYSVPLLKPNPLLQEIPVGEPFDPYRDALVVEEETIWPEEFSGLPSEEKARLETQLHQEASTATELDYVRLHTGFGRRITVTAEDIDRLKQT